MNANVHERVLTASDTLRDCRRVVRVVFLLLSLSSVAINLSDLQAQEFPSSAFQSPILRLTFRQSAIGRPPVPTFSGISSGIHRLELEFSTPRLSLSNLLGEHRGAAVVDALDQ